VKFLIDVQLPLKLAQWLRETKGVLAVHALEQGWGQKHDRYLWEMAIKENRILVSKDEDFFILASRPGDQGRLLWVRLGNCRTRKLIETINRQWDAIEGNFSSGNSIVEIR